MLSQGAEPPGPPFEGYDVLIPARDYRNRHASIMLALEATAEAMAEAERAACA
jgi:NifU-like protein involved in Fe-S cluster formation